MASKYIHSIPKPLLDDFVNNKVVPFVGAGFSANANIPAGISMPDWNGLGKNAAKEIPKYQYENNALDALSYYETVYSRPKLIEMLMRELHVGKIQAGATITSFCEVFTSIICTTNFDFLLEEGFRNIQRPISVVATEDRLTIDADGETKLIKLHGDFNHPDRMVVTETDYDTYIDKNPILSTYISNLFITKTMFLVGYSLDNYDFRNLWQVINSRLGKMARQAYCIIVDASPSKIARYQRRNIRVINLEGKAKDYSRILGEFFVELKGYIIAEKSKKVTSTDEKINEQLILPSDNNRLCFISASMKRISQLKQLLYPILYEMGITPVRVEDLVSLGDNWVAITETVITKSHMAIVDVSDNNSNVMFELGLIQSTKQAAYIPISELGTKIPASIADRHILTYTFDVQDREHIENFARQLKKACAAVFNDHTNKNSPFVEAKRLFDKNEYSACIISAISDLEFLFQKRRGENAKPASLLNTFKELYEEGKYSQSTFTELLTHWSLRNKIVHNRYKASKGEARAILDFVNTLDSMDTMLVNANY